MTYDLVIAGGGPAGVAAGVYAARKKIKTLLITDSFGGQSLVSGDVQNWIGTKSVSGYDLAKMLEEHLRAQEDIDVVDGETVVGVSPVRSREGTLASLELRRSGQRASASNGMGDFDGLRVATQSGKSYETKFLLYTLGSRRRKLGIPGEKEFDGRGVAYCSTCDAPIFKDKVVAVVGGGNAGLEAVVDLLPYAKKVYLVVRSGELKGDPITQEKVRSNPKVEIIFNALTEEILGKEIVTGLKYKDSKSGEAKELKLDGVFVEIGIVPNSEPLKNLVKLNKWSEVIVDHKTQETSHPRIWAAGDVTDVLYKQNNISAGDAVKAALNVYDRIHERPKRN